jgi:hypothetical protein
LGVEACLSGTELLTPPRAPASTFTLEFRADSADFATATALGWRDAIPSVAVTVMPEDSAAGVPQVLQSSPAGTVLLDQLVPGRYVVDAVRWLTDGERARLRAGDDAVGFVSRIALNTATDAGVIPVAMVASRRRGIVISEWQGDPLFTPQEGTYFYSGYLRLYNNADTTIYLDGLIIGSGLAWQFDFPNFPCSLYQPQTFDSAGVWAIWFHQVPGRGTDYPLPPGETAVLATDAIDHRPLFSLGLDLREATFEFFAGGTDVDNPEVPNAVDVGLRPLVTGHGLHWSSSTGAIVWVARPFDPAALHRQVIGDGSVWARIPGNVLLDVMAIKTTYKSAYPECPWLVNPKFDRQAVQLLGQRLEDQLLAYRRRRAPFTIGGRPVLQHTRTSAWDFTTSPRAPFAKP